MIKKISIPYFPKGVKYSTPVPWAVGIYLLISGYPFWGAFLILLGLVVWTTQYVTEIDLENHAYQDYLFFLGLKLSEEKKKFNTIDKIVISKGNYSQTVNTRVQSRQMNWSDYTATLLLDNGTLDLLTRSDKQNLLRGLKEFSDFLKVGVEDRTTNRHYWVDMSKF